MLKKKTAYSQMDLNEEVISKNDISLDNCVDCGNLIYDLHEGAKQCKECVWLEVRDDAKTESTELQNIKKP